METAIVRNKDAKSEGIEQRRICIQKRENEEDPRNADDIEN
jgi:hypothetical protein